MAAVETATSEQAVQLTKFAPQALALNPFVVDDGDPDVDIS